MKTGILFDLDGTLLDTLEDLLDATNYALAAYGHPPRTLKELRRFVGNGAENQIRLALPDDNKEDLSQVLAVYKPYYTANCQIKTKPYEGVLSALEVLGQKYPLAIVSNKPDSAVKALCADYFPGIYALGEISGCPRKPAADMVFKAMMDIGVDRCVYVGDSEVDVLTARNSGMPCVCVLWGFRDREDMEAVGGSIYCEKTEDLVTIIEETVHGQ
jgi:phosphoglycolate phosphatase